MSSTDTTTGSTALDVIDRVDGWIRAAIERLDGGDMALAWSDARVAELGAEMPSHAKFAQTLSAASRFAPRSALLVEGAERHALTAGALVSGWNPERWTALEAQRVRLILARAKHGSESLPEALEEAFRYADEGELCALYRSLQFLPEPSRFVWRAGEGCRTNMKTVFEANVCDTAFPAREFDEVAWRQLCIKALFVEAPLWRVSGLDERVDDELARMALDLADERRSAGRSVYPELWLCLGATASERALASIERELDGQDELSRKGAILALGRMEQTERLTEIHEYGGTYFGPTAQWALMGRHDRTAFRTISPPEGAEPETR